MLQLNGLARCCNISHFITTRRGGVSTGAYASMNPGAFAGDNPAAVRENRRRLAHVMGFRAESLFVAEQVHGAVVRVLDDTFLSLSPSEKSSCLQGVDGLITNVPGICVAVTTADCVPVLLYSPETETVAATKESIPAGEPSKWATRCSTLSPPQAIGATAKSPASHAAIR